MNRFELLFVATLLLGSVAAGQETRKTPEEKKTIDLQPAPADGSQEPPKKEKEVVITASKVEEETKNIPQSVGTVTPAEIERRQPNTAHQMLREEMGVYLSQANETFRFPIIRGRRGGDLVYLWDGTRQTQFHSLDFPVGIVDHVEYIRGPGGIQFGSDALGGVINMVTKRVEFSPEETRVGGELYARYGSNPEENTEYTNLWVSSRQVGVMVGGTHQEFDDFSGPRFGKVENSGGFDNLNFNAELAFKPMEQHEIRLDYLRMRKDDQVFYGQSKINASGIPNNVLPFEDRDMYKFEYRWNAPAEWMEELKAYAFYDTNDRLAHITNENATTINQQDIHVDQYYVGAGIQGVSLFQLLGKDRLVYGFDFRKDNIKQPRENEATDKATGAKTTTQLAGSIPASKYEVLDLFLLSEFRPIDSLVLSAGVRWERTNFTTDPDPIDAVPPFTVNDLDLDKTWNSVVWSAGAVYWINEQLSVAANVGRGFRVPTPFELVLTQVQGNVSLMTIPATTLDPVESITYEIGPRYDSETLKGSVTGYYTKLSNLIGFVSTPLVVEFPPGSGTFFNTRRNENSLDGYIGGVEAEASFRFATEWTVYGNVTYTKGQDTERDVPLASIPPVNGLLGLRWESQPKKFWAESVLLMAARFHRASPEDRTNQAFSKDPGFGAPSATNPLLRRTGDIPGYAVLNLRAGVEVYREGYRSVELIFGVDNVLNKGYRPAFAEVREEPGTAFTAGVLMRF